MALRCVVRALLIVAQGRVMLLNVALRCAVRALLIVAQRQVMLLYLALRRAVRALLAVAQSLIMGAELIVAQPLIMRALLIVAQLRIVIAGGRLLGARHEEIAGVFGRRLAGHVDRDIADLGCVVARELGIDDRPL